MVAVTTLVETVQLPPGSKVPVDKPNVVPLAAPPTNVALDPAVQLSVVFGNGATFVRPDPPGYVSVNEMPVSVVPVLAFEIVTETREGALGLTEEGVKDLSATGLAMTVNIAVLLGFPAAPVSVDVTPDVVFGCTPDVELVMLTVIVQLALGASAPPVRDTDELPATALTVPPPQLPTTPGAAATCIATRVSEKPTLVRATLSVFVTTSVITLD